VKANAPGSDAQSVNLCIYNPCRVHQFGAYLEQQLRRGVRKAATRHFRDNFDLATFLAFIIKGPKVSRHPHVSQGEQLLNGPAPNVQKGSLIWASGFAGARAQWSLRNNRRGTETR